MRHQFGGSNEGPQYISRPFTLDPPQGELDWTGVYAGFHLGAGLGTTKGTTTALDGTPDAIAARESADRRFGSPLPGVQVGWNYQLPNGIVVGAEADWTKAFFSGKQGAPANEGPLAGTDALQAETSYDVEWTSSMRGRIGYAAGRLLPYATGGIVLARETQRRDQYRAVPVSDEEQYGPSTIAAGRESVSATRTGITLGGGAEYALSSRLSIKGEYGYSRFGRKSFAFRDARSGVGRDYVNRELVRWEEVPPPIPPGDPACSDPELAVFCEPTGEVWPIYNETEHVGTSSIVNGRRASNGLEFHTFKIGLNYRF